jgi:histidinol-phosphate phosphatase family protein
LAILDRLADEFLVMYGDTMLQVDLDRFGQAHAAHPEAAATLFLHPNDHPQDSDLVEMDDDGWVTAFHAYPHDPGRYYPNLVNAALYWVKKSALLSFAGRAGQLDFGKHLFPEMLLKGVRLAGYNSSEYIKDCGTPARLDKVCGDFLSGRIARASLDIRQRAVFLDRDGTINREVGHLSHAEELELLPGVAQAVRRLNRSDYRGVLVTNQPVVARGDCSLEELRRIHAKLETLLGADGAYLDRIYFCPHHPDKGFAGEVAALKIKCDCRKPMAGMVHSACLDINIAAADSWLVGDTLVDMATARSAGLRSVLVETGCSGMDYRAIATPDYVVPDLPAAVNFILDVHPQLLGLAASRSAQVRASDLVLVGGLARSGKSNFSSAVAEALRARGLTVHRLSLDAWLLDESSRKPGVLGRYDLAGLAQLLHQRARGGVVADLSIYHKLRRVQLKVGGQLTLRHDDVVIVEGTVALALTSEFPAAHRYLVEIDEPERRRRVLDEYRRRGLDDPAAQVIYDSRQVDETPVVLALSGDAQRLHWQRLLLSTGARP